MTKKEWQRSVDCRDLLHDAESLFCEHPDTRLPRLLACAACRLLWKDLTDPRSRRAVEIAERYSDGDATRKELSAANRDATAAFREARGTPSSQPTGAAVKASRPNNLQGAMIETLVHISGGRDNPWEEALHSMIHDVFDNRFFRIVRLEPGLRTSTVTALALQMYESRDFSAMPILADALQDAGCDNDEVLNHCRGAGPHVRGCWVVDLVLRKE